MKNNIYLITEEFVAANNIEIILTQHFKNKAYECEIKNISVRQMDINKYFVQGIQCHNIANVYLYIAKGSGSFVDALIYEQPTDLDLNEKRPDSFWEITKNSPKESGNMTSQRLAKACTVRQRYGEDIPFYYLIDYHTKLSSEDVDTVSDREFGKFEAMGVEVFFTHKGSSEATKYSPIQVPKTLRDLRHNGKVNKLTVDNRNNVTIRTNLYKNKKKKQGMHDPNQGWTCGVCYLANKFGANSITLKSNKDLSGLQATNKLITVLNKNNVAVHHKNKPITIKKTTKSSLYWSMETTGEKLTTISLHQEVKNRGYDIIFSNHAGCERGFVKKLCGELIQPSGGRGLPDLVFADHRNKVLFVIEGEREINYSKGWIKSQLNTYKGYTACTYVTTNGVRHASKKHNLYSSTQNNATQFNKQVKAIYTIKL